MTVDLSSIEEETTEKPSVAEASIILMLLRWEAVADLTNRCAACELGWAGPGRAGLGRWSRAGKSGTVETTLYSFHSSSYFGQFTNAALMPLMESMLEELQPCRTQDQNTEYIKNKQIDNSNTGFKFML